MPAEASNITAWPCPPTGRCSSCLGGGGGGGDGKKNTGGGKGGGKGGGASRAGAPADLMRRVETSGDGRTLGLKKVRDGRRGASLVPSSLTGGGAVGQARLADAGAAVVGAFLSSALVVADSGEELPRPFIDTVNLAENDIGAHLAPARDLHRRPSSSSRCAFVKVLRSALLFRHLSTGPDGLAAVLAALSGAHGSVLNAGVKVLSLTGNRLGSAAKLIGAALADRGCPLLVLDLTSTQLGPAAGGPLAAGLCENGRLERLNIGGNQLGAAGAAAVVGGLAGPNRSLKALNLRRNQVELADPELTAAVAGLVAAGHPSLSELNLGGNPGQLEPAIAGELAVLLAANAVLWSSAGLAAELAAGAGAPLDLRSRKLGDAGVAALAAALAAAAAAPPSSIDLRRNEISEAAGVTLAAAIAGAPGLLRLALSDNPIAGTEAGRAVAGAAAVNTLQAAGRGEWFRSVSDRGLCDAGVAVVSRYLAADSVLASVGLHYNQIGPDGAACLSEGLAGNSSLTELSLYSNRIGPAGGISIAAALRSNRCLTSLDLGGNGLGDGGAAAFGAVLQADNRSLTDLHLDFNDIGPAGGAALAAAFEPAADGQLQETEEAAAAAVAAVAGGNTTLTNLWLHGNDVGPPAESAVASGMRRNTGLVPRALTASCQRLALAALLCPARRRPAAPAIPSAVATAVVAAGLLLGRHASAAITAKHDAQGGWAWRRAQHLSYRICAAAVTAAAGFSTTDADELLRMLTASLAAALSGPLPAVGHPPALPPLSAAAVPDEALGLPDRVAAASLVTYRSRCADHAAAYSGQSVLAAFVLERPPTDLTAASTLEVLSLGVGTKFLAPAVAVAAAPDGGCVRDSHAEVLARRALLRWLYAQASSCAAGDRTSLLRRGRSGRCELPAGARLHLYTSTAPCGNASWGAFPDRAVAAGRRRPVHAKGAAVGAATAAPGCTTVGGRGAGASFRPAGFSVHYPAAASQSGTNPFSPAILYLSFRVCLSPHSECLMIKLRRRCRPMSACWVGGDRRGRALSELLGQDLSMGTVRSAGGPPVRLGFTIDAALVAAIHWHLSIIYPSIGIHPHPQPHSIPPTSTKDG